MEKVMKNKTTLFTFLIVTVGVFLWQCEQNPFEPPGQSEVQILSDRFSPSTIMIQSGESILWRNVDTQTHSVKSGTFMAPNSDFPASGNMDQDRPTHVVTFNTPGTISYYCDIHQENIKEGIIIVE